MTQGVRTPLCEAICREIDSHTMLIGYDSAKAIVREHFSALSVEEVARVISGYEPLMWRYMSTLQKREYLDKAQAVMKLLRKE